MTRTSQPSIQVVVSVASRLIHHHLWNLSPSFTIVAISPHFVDSLGCHIGCFLSLHPNLSTILRPPYCHRAFRYLLLSACSQPHSRSFVPLSLKLHPVCGSGLSNFSWFTSISTTYIYDLYIYTHLRPYDLKPTTSDLRSHTYDLILYDLRPTIYSLRLTISVVLTRTIVILRHREIAEMDKGKRKHKSEEGEEDDKKTIKRTRIIEDFFHDKPE
jgi:hypothetical protein